MNSYSTFNVIWGHRLMFYNTVSFIILFPPLLGRHLAGGGAAIRHGIRPEHNIQKRTDNS